MMCQYVSMELLMIMEKYMGHLNLINIDFKGASRWIIQMGRPCLVIPTHRLCFLKEDPDVFPACCSCFLWQHNAIFFSGSLKSLPPVVLTKKFLSGFGHVTWTCFTGVVTRPGAHVIRGALMHLMYQLDQGVCCPITMTFAPWWGPLRYRKLKELLELLWDIY